MKYLSYLEVKQVSGIEKFLKIIHECFIIVALHQHAL